jgi:ribosomal protein S8
MHFLSSRLLTLSQASRAGRSSVTFSGSSFSKRSSRHRQILAILVDEGFLSSVVVQKIGSVPTLTVLFTYTAKGVPVLRRRYAVSKPSRRIYLPAASL